MLVKYLTTLALVATLSACATGPVYHPASKPGGEGFTDQKIQSNRYRVTFNGNSSTARETVEDFLLYRAAELTKEQGYDYFVMVEHDTQTKTTLRTIRRPAYYGRYSHYRLRPYYYSFPYYAYGFDWTYPYEEETTQRQRYSATAYVDMFKGVKPSNSPRAFDAAEVLKNLTPVVCLDANGQNCGSPHLHN